MTTIGLLHPGEMGASIGAALLASGHDVVWCSADRSAATAARASELEVVGSLAELVEASDVVMCICPPAAAVGTAEAVAECSFDGLYVDANAVSPATALRIHDIVTGAGADFVDGDVIGGPARPDSGTRLYVSAPRAGVVAELFTAGYPDVFVLGDRTEGASALKMAYAAWTKGSSALLLAVRAMARAEGVEGALLAEWDHSQAGLRERSELTAMGTGPKAWRFVGEMHEIAAAFELAGLPPGFAAAAAEVYERMGRADPPATSIEAALTEILSRPERG